MEPEGSLPHSQQPATCSYPEPDRLSPCSPSHLFKIHFNIIVPSRLSLSSGLLSPGFPTKTLYASFLSSIRVWIVPKGECKSKAFVNDS